MKISSISQCLIGITSLGKISGFYHCETYHAPPPYANVAPVNNAPDVVAVFHLVPNVEVNNANSVPEALNEDTSIDSKSPRIISEGPCCTAKVEQNVKVKQEPHLKPEVPSQDVVKQEPIGPKFENISVLNSVYQTPIFPVHGTSLNTNSVEQATTSQPKEEKFLSTEAADIIFSSGVNAKKKFYND